MSVFPIATIKTAVTASSLTISNIPQTYNALHLHVSTTGAGGTANAFPSIVYNDDTTSVYSQNWMYENGISTSTVYGSRSIDRGYWGPSITSVDNGGGKFSNQFIVIQDYAATDKWKMSVSEANDMSKNYNGGAAAIWKSTSAINKIRIYLEGGALGVGSKVTLMGVKA